MHHERRVADHGTRTQHRMTQSQRCRLTDVNARCPTWQDAVQCIQQFLLALRLQDRLEFRIAVEVIFDRTLRAAGDEDQRIGPC